MTSTTMATTERREFGRIFERKGSRFLWVRYKVDGRMFEESTRSTSPREAEKFLARRQAELGLGVFVAPDARRVTFADLAQLIRDDYRVKRRRSLKTLEGSLAHLEAHFGGSRALAITSGRVTGYELQRLEAGAARATVNKELAALRRMFRLAKRAGRLTTGPDIETPDPDNARQEFFEAAEFHAVHAELSDDLQPVFAFTYLTGWRTRSEVLTLQWRNVDCGVGAVRLEPGTTKNKEGRVFPFNVLPPLRTLLERQRERTTALERVSGQIIPWVFHRSGRPIRSCYAAWHAAGRRAGVVGKVPHDFRRTAARNLIRAGVPPHVAMRLVGWETDTMLRRYLIVNEADLQVDVAKLAVYLANQEPAGRTVLPLAQGTR